ncbi:MAG: DUF6051 family protein [Deltaproteobacteria bacterium]|jgi:hypothetical protein|nr:DUF6051 family protein [Deltaproteobacteria bacterium]
MKYLERLKNLKKIFSYAPPGLELPDGLWVSNHDYVSECRRSPTLTVRPGSGIPPKILDDLPPGTDLSSLYVAGDDEIAENRQFRYHIIHPAGEAQAKNLIILLHGFNDRLWDKYLPWAVRLVELTGQSVLLLPLSFHMNRAPEMWTDARIMQKVSKHRKDVYPDVLCSSLANAAISLRIHDNPDRFFWSGLESYDNIIDIVVKIKHGLHQYVDKTANINFFTYSIGSFLGEIVMMTNHDNFFSKTRMFLFCGGPVFNRLSPVSKFILDSEANVRLYSFLVEHLDSHRRKDPQLEKFLGETPVGQNFRAMLNYRLDRERREASFRAMADRLYAVALSADEVVPPYEVVNTLQGSARDVSVKVDVEELPYPYRHEDPFPAVEKFADEIHEAFESVFGRAADFLGAAGVGV